MDVARINSPSAPATQTTQAGARDSKPSEADQSAMRRQLLRAIAGSGDARLAPSRVEVRMTVDEQLDRVVARVIDRDSGKVVREIPPEALLDLARKMHALIGALYDRRV